MDGGDDNDDDHGDGGDYDFGEGNMKESTNNMKLQLL